MKNGKINKLEAFVFKKASAFLVESINEVKNMTVMRDAILNGFEDERYPGSELFGPRVLGNDAQEKSGLLYAKNYLAAGVLLGQ